MSHYSSSEVGFFVKMQKFIIEKIKKAGVIGAGGAGFPTHIKVNNECEYVIANGSECEPLLKCDQQMMIYYADEIIDGLEICKTATGAKNIVIATKEKYKDAIDSLKMAIKNRDSNVRIFLLKDFYPAGDEHILTYEVTGRIILEGGIPLNVGVLVQNVGTLINISRALRDIPVTSRFVTITGAVKNPCTLNLPIGTLVSDAIEMVGGSMIDNYKVVAGGIMMGKVIDEKKGSVSKRTSALIVLPDDHCVVRDKLATDDDILRISRSVCEQCSQCTDICVRYLLGHNLYPHKIMQSVGWNSGVKSDVITGAYLCCECGLCGALFQCPAGLSPNRINARFKKIFATSKISNPHQKNVSKVREDRDGRLVPVERLMQRLCLTQYNNLAILNPEVKNVNIVKIPLNEHIGKASEPIVKRNDNVKAGEMIAVIPDGAIGSNVHSSINGKVMEVNSEYIKLSVQ